jgi:hypothetical protein
MFRRITAALLVVALAGLMPASVEAKKTKKPKGVEVVLQMNWQGDCAGSGYLAAETIPNPDDCALFFPGLGDTYSFHDIEGTAFKLNAKKGMTVDFSLSSVVTVAADFEAVLNGTVGGKDVTIASATDQMTSVVDEEIHFDLEPDKKLHKKKVSSLNLTITWTNGVTYSSIDFNAGAPVVMYGYK